MAGLFRRRTLARPGGSRAQDWLELLIFVRACDVCRGRPVHAEILERALTAGLPGASVIRGIEGFGRSRRWHRQGLLRGGDVVPVLIEIAGPEATVRAFLPVVDEVVSGGLILLRPVTVRRASRPDTPAVISE